MNIHYEIAMLKKQNAEIEKELNAVANYKFWFTNWVYHLSTGEFFTHDIDREFNIQETEDKKYRSIAIKSMIADEIIQPASKKHGHYRLVTKHSQKMNFAEASPEPFPLWLPFNIHEKVKVFPGNIIQVNGEKNSGKTAFCLNIIKGNMHRHRVIYFNSEMGEQELGLRLRLDNTLSINSWNFIAYERSSDFADAIISGKGNINIIDFMEIHDEFYKIGQYFREIHDNLNGAIAIICIQLNKGADQGLGGGRTEEKPRLIINLMPGKLKLKMAKNWIGKENPNGKMVKFKLVNGIKLVQDGQWYKEGEQ